MGKSNIILLNPDMTFQEKTKKTEQDKILVDSRKSYTPKFTIGQSVFREIGVPKFKFWKKSRNLVILVNGSLEAFRLRVEETKDDKGNVIKEGELETPFFTMTEMQKYVSKIIAKSKAEQKQMSNLQTILLFGGLMVNLVIGVLILRNIGVF